MRYDPMLLPANNRTESVGSADEAGGVFCDCEMVNDYIERYDEQY